MPDRCSLPECRAISNRTFGKLSMFRLPKDENLRASWLKSMGKKDWNPAEKAVICERHFEPSCITKIPGLDKSGRRWKSKIAIGSMPTILVPEGAPVLPVSVKIKRRRRGRNKGKLLEVRRKKGRRRRTVEDLDSMPLQQRLTSIESAKAPKEQEKTAQTLKSQPLSPTKLKVTRQSAGKSTQQPKAEEETPKPVTEEICLKWNTHHSNLQTAFPALLNKEQYCDVTLVAEGKSLKCHKLILCSCSSYFDEVLEKVVPYQHPIIFMKDIPFNILKALCDFMYVGEVNIAQNDLDQILSVGDSLKIKGLASRSEVTKSIEEEPETPIPTEHKKLAPKPTRNRSKPTPAPAPENNEISVDAEITDPLDLMQPTYEEEATPDIPPPVLKRNEQTRKSTGKRVRKRKHVEVDHEPSPPVFRMRKGTRSRPNIKVPRYFNANFDNSAPPSAAEPDEYVEESNQLDESHHHEDPEHTEELYMDSYMNILEHIKSEPLDIEEGQISYEEESFNHDLSRLEHEPDPNDSIPQEPVVEKVVKRRKMSRSPTKAKSSKPDSLNTTAPRKRGRTRKIVENNDTEHDGIPEESVNQDDMQEIRNCNQENMEIENNEKEESLLDDNSRLEMQMENTEEMQLENTTRTENEVENNVEEEMEIENNELEDLENFERNETPGNNIDTNRNNRENMQTGNNADQGQNEQQNATTQIEENVQQLENNIDANINEEVSNNEDEENTENASENVNYYELHIENSYTDPLVEENHEMIQTNVEDGPQTEEQEICSSAVIPSVSTVAIEDYLESLENTGEDDSFIDKEESQEPRCDQVKPITMESSSELLKTQEETNIS